MHLPGVMKREFSALEMQRIGFGSRYICESFLSIYLPCILYVSYLLVDWYLTLEIPQGQRIVDDAIKAYAEPKSKLR